MKYLMGRPKRNLGNFAFLEPGWWVVHVVGIVLIFALGFLAQDDCYY